MLKKLMATSLISGTLVLGGLAPMASGALVQGGLVNVAIVDGVDVDVTLDDVIVAPNVAAAVQVPIGVAANVCNVSVAVLAAVYNAGGTTECDSNVNQRTEAAFDQILRITS